MLLQSNYRICVYGIWNINAGEFANFNN